jgi:hypothetical protein
MSPFGLAQISEFIAHFFHYKSEENFHLILNPEGEKQYLGNGCRNQPHLHFSSSYCVTWFFPLLMAAILQKQ